jgi:ATP-dependent HslUV protease ATP-binding subunit HslU
LHTILERVVEKISFEGPDLKKKQVKINGEYVRSQLAEIMEKEDLSKFIL